ncbi:MAG: hypothetical protein H8D45_30840 [Bacteroidetes bacterium]|nr:hypothetical protein [Bacteroidota bacterium]
MISSKFKRLLNEYIDDTINDNDKCVFEEYLIKNPDRKKEFEDTRNIVKNLNALPINIEPEEDLWHGIEKEITKNKVEFKQVSDDYYTFEKTTTRSEKETKNHSFPTKYVMTGLAAALILIVLIIYLPNYLKIENSTTSINDSGNFWVVSNLKGSPKIHDKEIKIIDTLRIGEWLITDDSSKALLSVAYIGEIILDPGTKLKFVKSDSNEHRILLDYGTINANINAKPRSFIVDTKSSEAVDLGCEYTFSVDHKGNGLLFVKSGMVELKSSGKNSLVSAGNFCITKAGLGPGTPYSKHSSSEFRKALLDLDFRGVNDKALKDLLKNAKKTDVMTLIQMLPNVKEKNKAKVFTKLASFIPPARKIYVNSIPELDMKDLNEWIEKLNNDINVELQENLENLNEEINKMVREKIIINFDNEFFTKEFQKELKEELKEAQRELGETQFELEFDQEELKKELRKAREEIDVEEIQKEINDATEELKDLDIDKEELKRELEEAQKEVEKANEELKKLNKEELKKEMEKLKEELKKNNEEIKKEQEKHQEEFNNEESENNNEVEEGEQINTEE